MTNVENFLFNELCRYVDNWDLTKIRPSFFENYHCKDKEDEENIFNACSELPNSLITAVWGPQHQLQINMSQEMIWKLQDAKTERWYKAHKDDEIQEIGIDIETYSPESIADCGVYRYAEHPDFEILLFAYSVNGGPVRIVDLAQGEEIPPSIILALTNPKVKKTAFNATFERICIGEYLKRKEIVYVDRVHAAGQEIEPNVMCYQERLQPEQWDCTMIRCARMSLPLSLAAAAATLGVTKKMEEGKDLIRYFSIPCKPTKVNGGRTRNLPEHAPDKWALFKRYCIRDVEVEQALRKKVCRFEMPAWETELYHTDSRINDRGVMIDLELVQNAERMDQEYKDALKEEARQITGLHNPNSNAQLKQWLNAETGCEIESLNKQSLPNLKARAEGDAARIIQIREELGKTSTKKYSAMLDCVCQDSRIRGLLQFCGAVRTGRWAGRLVQVQNLPQNHLKDLDRARNMVKAGDLDEMEMYYPSVPPVLSELIRTAFVAKPGCTFHVCDFSAIEARVIAWIANEKWVLDVFRTHGKIYEAAAAKMYNVPIEEISKMDPRRQKGKIATLALGYQGGVGALEAMGGSRMGLTDDEMAQVVKDWRAANPNIVKLWRHVEDAAKNTIKTREMSTIERGITFEWKWGGLFVTLPSGRPIYYPRAGFLDDGRIRYEGQNQTTKKWEEVETYGGKMTENIIQAFARDCLGITMLRLTRKGFNIVFHIHDECICEATPDQTLEQIEEVFKEPIPWAPGLPLKGAGYTTPYYLKD